MIVLNKGLDGFLHGLIPAPLRESLRITSTDYVRVRALTTMLVTSTALSAISILFVGGFHLLFRPDLLEHDLSSLAILLLLGLQVGLFYRFHNYWISSLAFTNFYFLIIAVLLILSGGYESQGTAILLTCPIMSFLIGGREEGMQNTGITIVFCWLLAGLYSIGFQLPNIFHTEDPYLIFSVNWVTTLFIIACGLMLYEVELQKRSDRLDAQVDPTRHGVSKFSNRLHIFMDGLIPSNLRANLDTRSLAYTRAQILSVLLVGASVISTATAVVLVSMHWLVDPEKLKNDSVVAVITLCFSLQAALFYTRHFYKWSALIFSYFYFMIIAGLVVVSGGYSAPFKILLLTCPIVFFMLRGIPSGVMNALFVAVVGLGFGYLSTIGFEFSNLFHDREMTITFGLAWTITILGVAACMMVYDAELEKPE